MYKKNQYLHFFLQILYDFFSILMFYDYYLQDYHWWWRSFLTSGFTAVYFFIYCIHYYVSKLELQGGASTFLYFGYMLIVVFLFFLLTGKSPFDLLFCRLIWVLVVHSRFNISEWFQNFYSHCHFFATSSKLVLICQKKCSLDSQSAWSTK